MKTSMKTCICIGLVILAVVGIAGCAGSNEQKSEVSQPAAEVTTPISEPTTAPGTVIATFSGEDSKNTEPFTVNSNTWKIEWEAQNSTKYKVTVFTVYLVDEKGLKDLVASTNSAGGETSYFYKPGTYHLEINSGAMPYNITVTTA